jgi:hypothetical protein
VSYKDGKRDGTWVYYGKPEGAEEEKPQAEAKPDAASTKTATVAKAKPAPASAKTAKGAAKPATKPAAEKPAADEAPEVADAETPKPAPPSKANLPQPIVRQEVYRDGLRDGLWITWHSNGKKATETNFRANVKHGKEMSYWESTGKKQTEVDYKDGLADGLAIVWAENGTLITQRRYSKGKPVSNTVKDAAKTAAK